MSFIEGYLIFAFSTALAACYIWFWPLIVEARAKKITNSFTTNTKLSLVIYILITSVVAPLVVLPLLFSSYAESFERGLRKEIFSNDKKS